MIASAQILVSILGTAGCLGLVAYIFTCHSSAVEKIRRTSNGLPDLHTTQIEDVGAAIMGVVDGDLNGLSMIRATDHRDLIDAAAKLPSLVLTRPGLVRVLKAWRSNSCSAEDVRRWASFIRLGFVEQRNRGPIQPIDISYDLCDEDMIVEVMARLDEIGDVIDGEISFYEREEMIRLLEG